MALILSMIGIKSGYVFVAITLVALPIAATVFANAGPAWQGIGKGRFAIEPALPPPRLGSPAPPVDKALQAAEARQMLEAKSYRRLRRGEAPIDVEAEVTRLLEAADGSAPDLDEKLRDEIREVVIAHNERRMRGGKDPLDVEAETERQLSDFIRLGQ
jgi:hypothetical protein